MRDAAILLCLAFFLCELGWAAHVPPCACFANPMGSAVNFRGGSEPRGSLGLSLTQTHADPRTHCNSQGDTIQLQEKSGEATIMETRHQKGFPLLLMTRYGEMTLEFSIEKGFTLTI